MPAHNKYIFEIATSDFNTTKSAVAGGADRIELCANLAEGGTTPSYGLIFQCREAFDILLYPIIRPRGGDFLYKKDEYEIMLHDVKLCKQLGCDGVVAGMLNMDGSIDMVRMSELIEIAYPMGITFHRAFDRCKNPFTALEELIEIGCERILTSGQKPVAPEGIELIAELYKAADDRIIIMPGSGVRKENIKMIADKTGCTEFHSSLRNKIKSTMQFVHPTFENPIAPTAGQTGIGSEESYLNNFIYTQDVKDLRNHLE